MFYIAVMIMLNADCSFQFFSLTNNVKETLHIYVLTAGISENGKHSNRIHQQLINLLDSLVKQNDSQSFVKKLTWEL